MSRFSWRAGGRRTSACSAGRSASRCRSAAGSASVRSGAYLPGRQRAALAVKLWQDAQFSWNRSPPRATSLPSSDSARCCRRSRRGSDRSAAVGLHVRRRARRSAPRRSWRSSAAPGPRRAWRASGRWTPGSRQRPRRRRSGWAPRSRHALQVGAVAGHAARCRTTACRCAAVPRADSSAAATCGVTSAWPPGHPRPRVRSAAALPQHADDRRRFNVAASDGGLPAGHRTPFSSAGYRTHRRADHRTK